MHRCSSRSVENVSRNRRSIIHLQKPEIWRTTAVSGVNLEGAKCNIIFLNNTILTMVLFWIESLMHFQDVMKRLDSVASYRPQSSWTSAKNTRARLTRRSTPVFVTRSYLPASSAHITLVKRFSLNTKSTCSLSVHLIIWKNKVHVLNF